MCPLFRTDHKAHNLTDDGLLEPAHWAAAIHSWL